MFEIEFSLRKERMDGYQWTCPVHVQRSYSLFCLFLLLVETCSFREPWHISLP